MTPPTPTTEAPAKPPEGLDNILGTEGDDGADVREEIDADRPNGEGRAMTPEEEERAKEAKAEQEAKLKREAQEAEAERKRANKRRVFFHGVPFLVERSEDEETVTLHHVAWPLAGSGATRDEAKDAVRRRIKQLAPFFAEIAPQFFSGDGKKFRAFVIAAAKVIDIAGGNS